MRRPHPTLLPTCSTDHQPQAKALPSDLSPAIHVPLQHIHHPHFSGHFWLLNIIFFLETIHTHPIPVRMLLATTYKKEKKINWHKEQGKLLLMQRPQKGRLQGWIGPEAPALHLHHALCHVFLYGGQTSLVAAKWLGQPNTSQTCV